MKDLTNSKEFIGRHIGPSDEHIKTMLSYLNFKSLDELIQKIVPDKILEKDELKLDDAISEDKALKLLKQISQKNKIYKNYLGSGYYGTITPNVILRNILENPGWYTAYTPYQPEVAQGRLEMLLNFQQMIIDLTKMDIANASLLDEGTATAEAVGLCQRTNPDNLNKIFISNRCNLQTIDVVKTRAEPFGLEIIVGDNDEDLIKLDNLLCAIVQYPDSLGSIYNLKDIIDVIHNKKGKAIVVTDLLALTLIKPPGELGADIVVGNSQRFGVPMGYGGPHAAFFATKDEFKRAMPGRIIGVSIDRKNKKALRMALQTREQHIRREKATSNICTAQALLSIMAAAYGIYHGPEGIRKIAERTAGIANLFAEVIQKNNFKIISQNYFDTVTIFTGDETEEFYKKALAKKINIRKREDSISISFDETSEINDLKDLFDVFNINEKISYETKIDQISKEFLRTSKYLTHEVFNSYHSETEMLRYLKRLEDKDIALNRSMIALGSCTMKLNAVAEMIPVTWPEFGALHPFVPIDQAEGYHLMFNDLSKMLSEITGFSGISLQPNAGAQGEYAGLMVIRKYHLSRGEKNRNICLIPNSAHGTNPASAQMTGMKVVVINCDKDGNVDFEDLKKKATEYSKNLAALMVTYPSTHGVFEEQITDICKIIHDNGGQVYMDGANLNALVGIAKPGKFGPDVCHMNLHKTFCIPHGGGGPGMGPIGVSKHLEKFLPNHKVIVENSGPSTGMGAVSAAPWGSASILPISWMYIKMMGADGLKKATQVAILSANYMSKKLSENFSTLYKGKNGFVAHECIIDLRSIKAETGVSEEDIAKRLIDYGFHAPTMSWPVAGTLMIEPTESESLNELNRFCNAFINIKKEINMIKNKVFDANDNPLKNAPHTFLELAADIWEHKYTREQAAFPLQYLKINKYWSPVSRVDNVYGDRNLVCSCPSLDSYREEAA